MENLVCIRKYEDENCAQLAKSLLIINGIKTDVSRTKVKHLSIGINLSHKSGLMVSQKDKVKAIQILEKSSIEN